MSISQQMSLCAFPQTHAWEALVDGQWGLRDLGTVDGRRSYALLEIPPDQRHRHRLSPLEVRVLQHCARGVPGKGVAYTLHMSQSTVSAAMRSAAVKWGICTRAELVQLAAHLLGTQLVGATHLLTGAEMDILQHIAHGRTNLEIAASRGSSMRTVANQVSSVLRKLRLSSRAAAAALSVFQPALSADLVSAPALA